MSARSHKRTAAKKGARSRIAPYTWLGAGAITLGMSAALVAGAGAAHAEDGAGSRSTSDSSSKDTSTSRQGDASGGGDTDRSISPTDDDTSSQSERDPGPQHGNESASDPNNEDNEDNEDSERADEAATPRDTNPANASADHSEGEENVADSPHRSGNEQATDESAAGPVQSRDAPPPTTNSDGADDTPDPSPSTARGTLRDSETLAAAATPAVAAGMSAQGISPTVPGNEMTTARAQISTPVSVTGAPLPVASANQRVDRFALAVSTLLKPIGTLLTELGGLILGTRADPVPPGACRDDVCNPTGEIYLPWVRNEVTVLNLTGRAVTLSDLDTKLPLTYGPQQGFVLDHARQVELAFYQGNSYHDDDWTYAGTMTWSDGATTVSVDVEAGGAVATTTNGLIQTVIFETPESITGPSLISLRETLVLLPEAGTVVTIDSTDPVGQALVAAALCKVSGTCTQDVVDEQVRLSAPKQVGNSLFNDGTVISTNRYKVVHEVTKTSGVEENLKIVAGTSLNFSLGPLDFQTEIGALVQQKYGHSWSDGFTTESQVDLDVPPGSYGQIYVQYPEYHDYVDMTLTNSGVTITIADVEYVSLAPSGVVDENGNPVAVTYTTVDWEIGTGPHPYPDSNSTPTPTETAGAGFVTTPDVAAPLPAPAATPRSLFGIIGGYIRDQLQAFRVLPNIVFAGRAISSQTIQIINLSPYAQTLSSITGEYEQDDSPTRGFVLQPFERIDIEVDYNVFVDQEAYVTWTNSTGIDIKAELKVFNGGSAPLVTCQTAGCIGDDADRDTGIMYLIYPYSTPGRMDVTNTPNLASAAVDVACTPAYGDAMPGGCGVNVTGDTYYNAPTSGPVQQQVNLGSQTNSYYYTITTTKTESASWAAGGGIKLKEKAGVFVGLQLEIEASVLYNSSVQVKDSESSTVVQNLLPDYGGAIYVGDPYLRTYGDYVVNLPNLTMIVTGQWIEAASGLAAQGPVATVVDYPLS